MPNLKKSDVTQAQYRAELAEAQLRESRVQAEIDAVKGFANLVEGWNVIGGGRRWADEDQVHRSQRWTFGPISYGHTYIDDRRGQRFLPWYESEWDLRALRSQTRVLDAFSAIATGAKESLVNYTLGTGFLPMAKPRNVDSKETPLSKEANHILELVFEENNFDDGLEFEIASQSISDGDTFVTISEDQRQIRIDLENPDSITEPSNKRQLEDWLERTGQVRQGSVHSWWYGVHTINRRRGKSAFVQDSRRPAGYHLSFCSDGSEWDYVPASRAIHLKRNVPSVAPRGVSDYVPVLSDLEKDPKLMAAMAGGEISRQNIVYVRQITENQGGSHGDIDSILSNAAGGTAQVPARSGGSSTKNVEHHDQLRIPTLRGSTYQPGPDGSSVSAAVEVQQSLRRSIGIRWSMPEFMISADASNANFSSTLVAESPFVKARERDQRWYVSHYKQIGWKVLYLAWKLQMFARGMGWLEVKSRIMIDISVSGVATRNKAEQAAADEILLRNKIKSRRTVATEHGVDFDREQQNRELDGDGKEQEGGIGLDSSDNPFGLSQDNNGHQRCPPGCRQIESAPAIPEIHSDWMGRIRANLMEDCGTGDGGFKTGNTCSKESGGKIRTNPKPRTPKTKSEIAKASAKYVGKEIQRYSEERNEPILAKKIGGKSMPDNDPHDVEVEIGGKKHGIELKTMVDNGNNKLTMKKSAMDRKRAWERKNKGTMHTVVFDDHAVFNAKGPGKHDESKRRIFYRRGYGSMRVGAMHEVTGGYDELKQLLATDKRKLPKGAK